MLSNLILNYSTATCAQEGEGDNFGRYPRLSINLLGGNYVACCTEVEKEGTKKNREYRYLYSSKTFQRRVVKMRRNTVSGVVCRTVINPVGVVII